MKFRRSPADRHRPPRWRSAWARPKTELERHEAVEEATDLLRQILYGAFGDASKPGWTITAEEPPWADPRPLTGRQVRRRRQALDILVEQGELWPTMIPDRRAKHGIRYGYMIRRRGN